MTLKKDDAISNILSDFENCANLVLSQLDLLHKHISSGGQNVSGELLDEITQNEKKLDKFEVKISDKIVNAIVLYSPMASDLRKIISCYRIIFNLERIGDQLMNIIYFLNEIENPALFSSISDIILNMLDISADMVKKALLSFINNDKALAVWTIRNDAVIDDINNKALKKAFSKNDIPEMNQALIMNFILIKEIATNVERIADHATNIAEAAIYSFEGKDVRHHKSID